MTAIIVLVEGNRSLRMMKFNKQVNRVKINGAQHAAVDE